MTQEETIEGNNLIHGFISYCEPLIDVNGYRYAWRNHVGNITLSVDLAYHRSWDWLIPVCRKIIETKVIFIKGSATQFISAMRYMKKGLIEADIDRVYSGVVYFIKWYNSNK